MSQKLYELALEIQGRLDGSFTGAMRSAQGDLKNLEGEVKSWQDRQKKVSGIDAAYIRASEGARQLGGELAKLKKQQKAVSEYQEKVQGISQTAKAYKDAQRQVQALTAAYAKDKTPANKKAMQDATKQAKALERQYVKNQGALKKMGTALKEAGINTKDLGNESANLANRLVEAEARQNRFASSAERIAHLKANWADLTSKVQQYGHKLKWAAALGASLAAGTFMLSKSAAERADAAAKAAKKVRTDAEAYQKIEYIASLSGVKDIEGALVTMNRNISDFATTGKGKAADMIKRLRFNTKEFLDMEADEKLIAISKAFQKITNEGTRTSIAKAFFGGQEAEMREFLRNSPEQIRKYMKEAEELGWVIKNKPAEAAEGFLDNITRLQNGIQGLKNTIGIELMPIVDDIVKRLTGWIKRNRELVAGKVADWAKKVADKLPAIWDGFEKIANFAGKFIDVIDSGTSILGGFTNTLDALLKLWLTKKAFNMGKWIVDTGKAVAGIGTGGGAAAAATTASTAAGGALASGAATTAGAATAGTAAGTAAAGTTAGTAATGAAATTAASGGLLSTLGTVLMNLPLAGIMAGTAYLAATTPEDVKRKALKETGDFGITPSWIHEERPKTDAFVDAMMKLAEQRQIAVSREDIQNEQGRLLTNLQGQTTSRWFMSEGVSQLLDAALDTQASLLPRFDELNEQAKLDVKREDVAQYSVQLMDCIRGNELAIRDLPERLRPVLEVLRPVQPAIIEHHARGGLVSHPTLTTFAERGEEVAVPTASADRSLGLSSLFLAARKLNVPILSEADEKAERRWDLSRPLRFESESKGSNSSSPAPARMPEITFSPTIYVTAQEGEDVAKRIDTTLRQSFAEMMRDFFDEERRVAYAT